jgi:hypothetical protein
MNPLTKAELSALMSTQLGNLRPYQIEQIADALRRRGWERPGDVTAQSTLSTLVAGWGS